MRKYAENIVRLLVLGLLLIPLLATGVVAESVAQDSLAQLPENPKMSDYLIVAEKNNPELKASFYRWKAKVAKSGYAGTLPDPILSYGYFIEKVETRVGPQQQKLSIRQMIPWIGKLTAEKNSYREESEAALSQFEQTRLELLYRVKSAYYELYYLEHEINLTKEQMTLLTYWESIVRTKYTVGLKQHPDLLKAQVELGKLEERLATLQEKQNPLQAELRQLLNVSQVIEIDLTDSVEVETVGYTEAEIESMLGSNRSLESLDHLIKKQDASVAVASRQKYPNLTFGLDYIQTGEALSPTMEGSGKDPLMVSVGLNLPIWWGKNKAKTNEAKALRTAYKYERQDMLNRLKSMTSETLFFYNSAVRRVNLYRDGLIPKAQEAVQAGFAAYESDQADFLSLIESQKDLLAFHLAYIKATVEAEKSRAKLEVLTGKEIINE